MLGNALSLSPGNPLLRKQGGGVPQEPSAPANSVAPVISGTPTQGQSLAVAYGTWSGYPAPSYATQWKRNGANISGATGMTYLLVSADVGTNITCTVTATNPSGSASANSNALGPVAALPVGAPVNSVLPVITGTPTVGQTLTTSNGTWSNSPTGYAYQWRRNGVAISGATATAYTLINVDEGATITVAVTASNAGGSATAVSAGVGPVAAAPTSEIAWTPAMIGAKSGYTARDASSFKKTDGTQAAPGDPVETWSDVSGNARDLVSAAGTAGASTAATRAPLGPVETLGSFTGSPLRMNSGVLTHRYLGPASGFSMPSGSLGDILFLFARHRPAQTAVQRVAVGNSAGNFNTNIATSSTTAAGQVYTGGLAGTPKTDLTTRLEILVQEKKAASGNNYNLRVNGSEVLSPDGAGSSVATTSRVVLGNVYGTSSLGADMDAFEFWTLPQGTTRANIQRFEGWCAHFYQVQDLLPADHPNKSSPPMVPAGTTTTVGWVDANFVTSQARQTWLGPMVEIQADSFDGSTSIEPPKRLVTNVANRNVTISISSPTVITLTSHGLTVGDRVVFGTSGALPSGITAGARYFVSNVINANTFNIVFNTPSGATVATTGTQSGTHFVSVNDPWAWPYSLTPAERARAKSEWFPGDGTGYMFPKLPVGFANGRGARNIDVGSGLAKNCGERFDGQNAALSAMFSNLGPAGGGGYVNYWSPAPYWKTNSTFGGGAETSGADPAIAQLWAGGSYARNVTLSSIRLSDPPQYNLQTTAVAAAMVNDVEYIHQNIVPVRIFGLQNEATNATNDSYGHCYYPDGIAYADLVYAVQQAIISSTILSTYGGQPNTILITADSYQGFPSGYTSHAAFTGTWAATRHHIPAHYADGDYVKAQAAGWITASAGKANINDEFEYFPPLPASEAWQFANTVLVQANWMRIMSAPTHKPMIHIAKPLGQATQASDTKGYGVTAFRLPAPFGQDPSTPGDSYPTVNAGEYVNQALNANAVKTFSKNIPAGSKIMPSEYTVGSGQQIVPFVTPAGKRGYVVVNRSAPTTFAGADLALTLSFSKQANVVGKLYSDVADGSVIASASGVSSRAVTVAKDTAQVWMEQ